MIHPKVGQKTTARPIVSTNAGPILGRSEGQTDVYRGVPYARPPLGHLRWQPPLPPVPWTAIRDAGSYGPACIQVDPVTRRVFGSEDCLSLNIWRPCGENGLPVMVYLHGGNNVMGSSASPNGTGRYYDGRNLAASGPVVVVTLNYRLGALGFLAHPALATADGYMGNYGLLDQLEALRWIQRNIKSFGGDPDRVMVFGQSAGAIDLSALLVSPLSKGLFSRAAMQSGVCTIVSADSAEHTARQVQSLVGAGDASDVAAALRAVPAEILVRLPGASVASNNSLGLEFGPVLDRHLLPASPLAAIRRGTHMHMPILMGTTSEEYVPDWLVELVAGAQVRTEHEYILATERLWGAGAASVRRVYSAARYASAQDALAEALSDALMCAPTRRFARALAEAQCEPVWCYVFDRPGASGRAGHGDDIPFIFQSCAVPDDGQDLAMQMAKYWTTFAATGNPNHNAAPAWPQYSALRDRVLLIAREIGVAERFRSRMLDLWDAADAG